MGILDLLKALGLMIGEMIFLWLILIVIKLFMDRSRILRKEKPERLVDLSINTESILLSPRRADLGFAEIKIEEARTGKILWYTSEEMKGKDQTKCGEGPIIVYNIQNDQNFACLLDKKE